MSISSLDVNQRIIDCLKQAKLTDLKELLLVPKSELQKSTKLALKDVVSAKVAAAKLLLSEQCLTAQQLLQNNRTRKLPTGCPAIDKLLRGGIVNHGITEVTGESASGKTQLCLQLAIRIQLRSAATLSTENGSSRSGDIPERSGSEAAGAIYISTESRFPSRRLQQMIEHVSNDRPTREAQQVLGDRVFVKHVSDQEQLMHCLAVDVPALLRRTNIGLVVIDSIAALFRGGQYDLQRSRGLEIAERSRDMARLAVALHRLADDRRLHVLCVNQVTADVQHGSNRPLPALGLNWANFVTTRLQLLRSCNLTGDGVRRHAELCFAPHLPAGRCEFSISASGLVDVGGEGL